MKNGYQKNKIKLTKSFQKIFVAAKNSKLSEDFITSLDNDIKYIQSFLKCKKLDAVLLSIIYVKTLCKKILHADDIFSFLNCNNNDYSKIKSALERLSAMKLVNIDSVPQNTPEHFSLSSTISINKKFADAFISNTDANDKKETDVIDFLQKTNEIVENHLYKESSKKILIKDLNNWFLNNAQIPIVVKLNKLNFGIHEQFIFYYLVRASLTGENSVDLSILCDIMFDCESDKLRYLQSFYSGDNLLIINNLIDFEEGEYLDDISVYLTDYAKTVLQESSVYFRRKKIHNQNLIAPEKIKSKELFYNDFEKKELDIVLQFLEESNYKALQKNLTDKKLPTGITAIFYGDSGTGKTETVYQLAKKTSREIMHIDISQTKSKWFGETEKIIKKHLDDYKTYAKETEKTPILLFNEADAIISKRSDAGLSHITKTENAIQNILLEELEDFNGIFIATTNLLSNIDTAFERRFLFKIEFKKPSAASGAKIWKSKMPHLSTLQCEALSKKYGLSGGEIDNIVKKHEMHKIICSSNADINTIMELCENEKWKIKSHEKIGFKH